jgi:hypothetical protein
MAIKIELLGSADPGGEGTTPSSHSFLRSDQFFFSMVKIFLQIRKALLRADNVATRLYHATCSTYYGVLR